MSGSQVKSIFTNLMNRGGKMTYTTKEWLEDVKMMYSLFIDHHPTVSVTNFDKFLYIGSCRGL